MSYFIFSPNLDNVEGVLYRIAENESDLNNLNIDKSYYKIIEVSQSNFDLVKLRNKHVKYNGNTVIYLDETNSFKFKIELQIHIDNLKNSISKFIKNNPNHTLINRWNNYYTQLNNLNLDSIQYPLNTSLEQYFKDQNLISLSPLQIP